MNLRKLSFRLSGWLLAPAIVVATPTVDARVHAFAPEIQPARCPNARAAISSGRSGRSGGSAVRKKPAIWNIRGRGQVPQRPGNEENSRRAGFYDEHGNFHADGPSDAPIPKP